MYKVEPIISNADEIPLPTCMYKVKNIYQDTSCTISSTEQTEEFNPEITQQKPLKNIIMLEARQDKLLHELEQLRLQMMSIKKNLQNSLTTPAKVTITKKSCSLKNDLMKDIVINVNPSCPPYSLLILQRLLNLKISCHTHSSVVTLPPAAVDFTKDVSLWSPAQSDLSLTLIWKDVDSHLQLITCSTMPVIICGEVNLLRYLLLAAPSQLTYCDSDSSWEVDSLLDVCHKLQENKTVKERQANIRCLNGKLGKQNWIQNNQNISVVDIAAWSIIKQNKCEEDLTVNMKNWMERCKKYSTDLRR